MSVTALQGRGALPLTASYDPVVWWWRRIVVAVTVPDVHAGTWIDTSQRVMTYWFVGDDVSQHRDAINELAEGAAVCVSGGARWSRAELEATADQVSEIVRPDAKTRSAPRLMYPTPTRARTPATGCRWQ